MSKIDLVQVKTAMVRYALYDRELQCYLGVKVFPIINPEFSDDQRHVLHPEGEVDNIWMVAEREYAEKAINDPSSWYNAGHYYRPQNPFEDHDLVIMELSIAGSYTSGK